MNKTYTLRIEVTGAAPTYAEAIRAAEIRLTRGGIGDPSDPPNFLPCFTVEDISATERTGKKK